MRSDFSLNTLTFDGMLVRIRFDDSITVSSAWELTSVYMRYSQGEGINTSLSRIIPTICTSIGLVFHRSLPFLCVYGYLPWHGHVLLGTPVTNIMCLNQLYLQG